MRETQASEQSAGVAVAKVLAELHPQPPEDVPTLVAVGDRPRAPPGIARRDLDDEPVAGRGQHRVDLGSVRLALASQHPAHDVDPLGVPAGGDAEARRAADGRRFPRRRGLGDPPLNVGTGSELRRLIQRLGRCKGPGAGGDRHGQRLEIAERTPGRAGKAESADPVPRVDTHRLLPRGRLVRARPARLRTAGFAPHGPDSGSRRRRAPDASRRASERATGGGGRPGASPPCGSPHRRALSSRGSRSSESNVAQAGSTATPVSSGRETRVGENVWPMCRSSSA